jgi:oxygen-independent coproporphyrinogen-3 oxidase
MARAGSSDPGWMQAADDAAADMYLEALAALDRAGYAQYEISNVSRPGRESRHNLKYWQSGAWRGFGCGAHSTVGAARWQNVASTQDYIARVAGGQPVASGFHERSEIERKQEALFTGLRLSAGIDRRAFAATFGVDPWPEYGEILATHEAAGFVWASSDRFGLTRPGMLLANEILAAFV